MSSCDRVPASRPTAATRFDAFGRGEELMGDVEAGHEGSAVSEHHGRRLRVGPHIELADCAAIAEHPAAHHADALEGFGEVRSEAQGDGDVGQGPDSDDPRPWVVAAGVDDEPGGIVGVRATACSSSAGPSSPLAPWTSAAATGSASSGRAAPAWTGTSRPSSSRITSALRVVRSSGAFPATVVIPRRSHMRGDDADGDGVVVAGITVEHDAQTGYRGACRGDSGHEGLLDPCRCAPLARPIRRRRGRPPCRRRSTSPTPAYRRRAGRP